jgi:hypothetical protein
MKARLRTGLWLTGAALAFSSTLALAAPESLLPPDFDNPAPIPAPAPRPAPAPSAAPGPAGSSPSQATPSRTTPGQSAAAPIRTAPGSPVTLPANFPSLREIEAMEPDELDELFGLKPKFDIPPGAQRDLRQIGLLGEMEGGFAAGSLASQPAALIQAALRGTKGPLVSRWGHILLRRALASRLDAPQGMDPVAFTALRASVLNRIGEGQVARALVQDIDSANYSPALAAAAFDAYLATGDILGMCPVAQLKGTLLEIPEWKMSQAICNAYSGNTRQAEDTLRRAMNQGLAPRIDVLLAQRYAGAAGEGRRAVTIEWDNVDELTPWRLGLSRALGVELPEALRSRAGARADYSDSITPAVPLVERAAASRRAGADGILSSAAMVDLFSQVWADPGIDEGDKAQAGSLRNAYAARDLGARLSALRELWGEGGNAADPYGGLVLTAYAAARLPVDEALIEEAPRIVGSMLAAGLDRNALRWGNLVPAGSHAWGLLALAQPGRENQVSSGSVDDFIDSDNSAQQRKSQFLVAGLAGLGRLDEDTAAEYIDDLGSNMARQTAWSRKIDRAAELNNAALVALLAGLGMQGDGWDKMTARHLFHIVRALNRVGLDGEARMIAAEAVSRA